LAKILVHVTCGPEQPTKAALAFLVAKAAIDDGHKVSLFLAGDGVQLLRDAGRRAGRGNGQPEGVVRCRGSGRGDDLRIGHVVAGGVSLEGKAEPAMPNRLVELTLEHDRVLTY